MAIEKSLTSGTTPMLLMKLLLQKDMYGYELIEALKTQSNSMFELKAGTLYPLLHTLEDKGYLTVYEQEVAGKVRKYYHLTEQGRQALILKEKEWMLYVNSVKCILKELTISENRGFEFNHIPWCSSLEEVSLALDTGFDVRPQRMTDDGSFVTTYRKPDLYFYGYPLEHIQAEFKGNGLIALSFDLATDEPEQTYYKCGDILKKQFGQTSIDKVEKYGDHLFHVKQWWREIGDSTTILQLLYRDNWLNVAIRIL